MSLSASVAAWAGLRGDLNGDGAVDVTDVSKLIDMVLGKQPQDLNLADLDGNGFIDVSDVNGVIDVVLGKDAPIGGRMVGMGEGQDSVPMQRILDFGLEVIDIELNDGLWPTADYVTPPPGGWGRTTTNHTKVPGRMQMLLGDSVLYDTGQYVDGESGMTLRIRGNTSAYLPKKPYKIKLQKKADLLRRDSIDGRDKDWVLTYDETLHYLLGFEVGRLVGMKWTPGYRYVNVVVNNQYEGIYLLLESVKRNTNCRLDVAKEGYIFEHDQYWWNEPLWLPSTFNYPFKYTFKYPDVENFAAADSVYMTNLTQQMENAYVSDNYPDVIDVRSFARFCLVHDIMGTCNYGANRYYIKHDKSDSTLVEMPLVWDFSRTHGDTTSWSLTHTAFFDQLFSNPNRAFVEEFANRWNQVSPILYAHVDSLFKSEYKTHGEAIIMSVYLDNKRWNTHNNAFKSFSNRPDWINKRTQWIDQEIVKLFNENEKIGRK